MDESVLENLYDAGCDQDESEIYGDQVNIGVITCPLADLAALEGSYDVAIELDQ